LLYIVNNTGQNSWSGINIIFNWEKKSSWSKLAWYFLILFIKTFLGLLFIWHCRKNESHHLVLYKFYKISNLDDSSKLFLYSKLKTDIKLEDYLKLTKYFNNRQLLTKFRTSDQPLEIELVRSSRETTWDIIKQTNKNQLFCNIVNNELVKY
jgi:hypothetical protein